MSRIYNPGQLEIYCGPMRSGKNSHLISRISPLEFSYHSFIIFNPDINIRDNGLVSRISSWNCDTHTLPHNKPIEALKLCKDYDVIVFVEAQFYALDLVKVIDHLIHLNKNIIVIGLDLDFRGEPFGPIPFLLSKANKITKLTAVCTFKEEDRICGRDATRTQRYINNKPADYNSPIVLIGDFNEGYEPHCIFHHSVPNSRQISIDLFSSEII